MNTAIKTSICVLAIFFVSTAFAGIQLPEPQTTAGTKIPKPRVTNTPKVDPVQITVMGIRDPAILKNVNLALKTLKEKHITKPISLVSLLQVYNETPKTIANAVKPFGYFSARVVSKSNQFSRGIWHSTFYLKLGPPTIVSKVDIQIYGSGKGDKNFLQILDHYPVKEGKILKTGEYSDGNSLLFGHAANLGYFKAHMVKSKIIVNLITHKAQIIVKFDTGIRHHFGKTTFTKNPFNEKFLRKFLTYKVGEPYLNSAVNQTQTNLANANYFNQVVVTPEIKKSVNGVTPMNVELKMRKRKSYTFGAGYSTDTGPRATLGFIYRWVNQWGHYFDARFQGSFVNNILQVAYHIPSPNPVKDLLTFRVAAGRLDVSAGTSNSEKFAIDYAHKYTTWDHTFSLNFLNEKYDINSFNLPESQATMIYPSLKVRYYSTTNHINPDQGMRLIFDLEGTPQFLSTSSGFAQFRVSGKAIYTLLEKIEIVPRAEFGVTAIKSITNLPLSLQLLAGGSESIRGYQYDGTGPGKNLFTSEIELRYQIWKMIYLAGFYDLGNVSNGNVFKNTSRSTGPGVVFRSPIGVIGVYAAWRLSKQKPWPAFVFSMGPEI